MQPLLWYIVVAYLAVQGLETVLTVLNLNHLARHGARVPEGFEGSIDRKLLAKMKDYTLEGSRLDLIASFFTVAVTLWFLFGGALDRYNRLILGLQLPEVWSGVLFFLFLSLAGLFLRIPFSLYTTFNIERKYGFNTQTFGLWIADLLKGLGKAEILAILAHEAGHWRKKHLVKKLVLLEAVAFLGLYPLFRAVQGDLLTDLFGIGQPTISVKILLAGFVGSIGLYPLQPVSRFFSRRQEVEADDYAAELTGNPQSLARSLVVLGRDNLANLHPHPLYAAFHYSHPPLAQRVARLLRMS